MSAVIDRTRPPKYSAGAALLCVGNALQHVRRGEIVTVLATLHDPDVFGWWKHECLLTSNVTLCVSAVALERSDYFSPLALAQ